MVVLHGYCDGNVTWGDEDASYNAVNIDENAGPFGPSLRFEPSACDNFGPMINILNYC